MRVSRDNWIVLGILAVLSTSYFLVVYRLQSRSIDQVKTQVVERQRHLENDAAKAARVGSMVREIETMKQRFNKDWDRRLPQRKELAGFLREISSNLSREKLSNTVIQPGNPGKGPLYNRLPISMKFDGDFMSLAGFLQQIDNMTRLTRIEQLTVSSQKDNPALAVELGMNIYFTEQ